MASRAGRGFLCLLVVLMSTLSAYGAEYHVPLMAQAPTLDGRIEPGEWAGALRIDGFGWQGHLERRLASGYVGADSMHLYFAVRSQLPAEGTLLADVQRDSENLVFDDSLEVWIDPDVGKDKGRRFQMLANSAGHRWYKLHPFGGTPDDPAWHGDWTVQSSLHDGVWDYEVSVPLASIAPERRAEDGVWGLNLTRNWKQEWAWSSLGGDQYAPTDKFIFTQAASPVVQQEQRTDPLSGDVNSVLALHNPGSAPLTVRAGLTLTRDVMPELAKSEAVMLAPGETKEVALAVKDAITKKFTLSSQVTSPDGATTYFARKIDWAASPGPWRWATRKKVIPPVDFQFFYSPYANTMRLLADVSNLPHDATLERLTAVVRPKGSNKAIKTVTLGSLVNGRQEIQFTLPPLKGRYEIALKAVGKNVPDAEVVKPFERTAFPWEHDGLGQGAKVYPPFTPIRVQGSHVATVLREHVLNGAGLWDQVTAGGAPILAAPMRWGVTIDGTQASVKAGGLKWTETAANRAVARSGWRAGALGADVLSTWDYDGTMRVDLTLRPSGGKRVDALTLDIPLKRDQATLMHAMGDGIRNTISARVPDGAGTVWTAASVQSNDLPKNFCSYLYVGTANRGLSWFAENDKNWGWDPQTPNVEIVRQAGQVILRVHLINAPGVIDKPRTLTFGLLAAPVKPRLSADWRHKWRRDNYSLLGTDINWLALGDAASVYPAGQDMSLWEMIKRGNREHLTDAEIDKVVARGTPYFTPYGPEVVDTFVHHARHNLTGRYGTKMVFYYNRASYQAAPEFQTFGDEWGLTDWRGFEPGNGRGELKIVPTPSYVDHALYWYGKSFELGGNQGVYWDNWFFNGSYNTEMTGAYKRPDGTVIPSTGIWGLRELAKRTFQFMNERGMMPLTMAHMTSTSILPLLSFATVQYDWEWHYSEGDVQGRFSREYLQLASDGQLAGTWPVVLADQGALSGDLHTGRTFAGVAMLHELDCSYADWTKTGKMQRALFAPIDSILAQSGVQAYRYWDDRPQPIKTDNPDLPTIVYCVKGKRAVFAVVSYADSDQTAKLTLDPAALGFGSGYKVVDTETGQEIPVTSNTLSFPLPKHDLRVCEVTPR